MPTAQTKPNQRQATVDLTLINGERRVVLVLPGDYRLVLPVDAVERLTDELTEAAARIRAAEQREQTR